MIIKNPGKEDTKRKLLVVAFDPKTGERKGIEKASLDFMGTDSISSIELFKDVSDLVDEKDILDMPKMISTSQKMYKVNGAYAQIVNFLTNLTNSGFIIHKTGNEEADKKYKALYDGLNKSNINSANGIPCFMHDLILDFFRCKNVYFTFEGFESVEQLVYNDEGIGELITVNMPKIKVLNPHQIEIEDAQIEDETFSYTYNGVAVKQEDFFHISDKLPYEKYGTPLFAQIAFSMYGYLLAKILDNSSLDGLINSMMIIEIPEGLEDDADEIVSSIIAAKKANMAATVNEGVKVHYVGSKGTLSDLTDRVSNGLSEIFASAGVSQAIITAQKDIDGDALIPHILKIVIETESYHKLFVPVIQEILIRFAKENGITEIPSVGVLKSPLRLLLFNKHMLQLFDRGLISGIQAVKDAGYSIEEVLETFKQQTEKDMKQHGFMTPSVLPYHTNGNPSINADPNTTPGKKKNDNPLKDDTQK